MNRPSALLRGFVFTIAALATSAQAYQIDTKSNTIRLNSLPDFDTCVKDTGGSEACLAGLRTYADKNPAQAHAAGKRARLNYQHWAALYFFDKALAAKAEATLCADADVAMAVVSGLALPSSYPNVAPAQRLLRGPCFAQLKDKVVQEMKEGSSYYTANACPVLAQKGLQSDRCTVQVAAPAAPAPSVGADVAGLAKIDTRQLKLDQQSAVVLRGEGSQEVMLIRAEQPGTDVYLVKFKGIAGPWNGKVFATAEREAPNGKDYVMLLDGREWTAVTRRGSSYGAYPQDAAKLSLYRITLQDERRRVGAADVVNEFRN